MTFSNRFYILVVLLPFAATLLSACQPVVRERTLPPSIRSVTVPMAVNRTSEPAFEEYLTVAVQEEFDFDGRIRRARNIRDADAIIRIYITDWETSSFAIDADGFPTAQEYALTVHVQIRENIPGRPMIGPSRVINEVYVFNADTRTTTFVPEPRRREELTRRLARTIVREVITGDFTGVELQGPAGAPIVVQ